MRYYGYTEHGQLLEVATRTTASASRINVALELLRPPVARTYMVIIRVAKTKAMSLDRFASIL